MADGKYTFNIIHEAVATDDKFPDKTHEKAANALFDLMQSSERGITIGLEGGWGSGKSTVVNLLRKRLVGQDDRTLFFLFDAWAHEDDPLRRIFLESLIDNIDPNGNSEELSKLKGEISGRIKTVEVTTKKRTSRLGGLVSLSAILVPVGAAVLSGVNYESLQMPWNAWRHSPNYPFVLGLFTALAPAWVLLWWRCKGDTDEKREKTLFAGDKQWDVFAADSTEGYTQDITEDGERTSIEFEQYFSQIMDCSVGVGKPFNRALIVIDNLDRVEPEQTLAIWSILQTFFQHRSHQVDSSESNWQAKLWFLIPYDREGLSRVWNTNGRPKDLPDDDQPLEIDKVSHEVAPSFLDKCFQVVAEVPEPVNSAWVDYCENTIQSALNGWPKDAVRDVIETFKQFESRLDTSPTPRQILVFTNRVGLLGLRWGEGMSAEAIALYALLRKNRSDRQLRQELLQDGLPGNYEGRESSGKLKGQLAGMLFGVDETKGMQLLLGPEIKAALNKADSEAIKRLIGDHGEGFWVAWESIKGSSLPKGHVEEYRIAITKGFCNGVAENKGRAFSSINRLVSEWKSTDTKWELERYDYSEALKALIETASSGAELLPWLEGIAKQSIKQVVSSVSKEGFNPEKLPNISKLITLLEHYGVELPRLQYKSLDQESWKLWQEAIGLENLEFSCVLPVKGTVAALANSLDINNPATDTIKLLIVTLSYVPTINEWDVVADKLVEWGNNPNRQIGNNDAYELMLHILLKCSKTAKDKITTVLTTPSFIAKIEQEDVAQTFNVLPLCAVGLKGELLTSGLGNNISNYWQSKFDQDQCLQVINVLQELSALWVIWLLATDANNEFAIGLIKSGSVDDDIYISDLGPKCVGSFAWASEDDLADIISKASEYGGLAKAKIGLVESPVDYRSCLKLIGLYGGLEGQVIVEEALKNVTASQWADILAEDRLLFDCIKDQGNHEFKDGFVTFAKKELAEGELSDYVWDDFGKYYDKLMDKEDVAGILTKRYFEFDGDPLSDKSFDQFSPIAARYISPSSLDDLMKKVENWLASSQWMRVTWLIDTGFEFSGELNQSLVSRITVMLDGTEPETEEGNRGILLQLANFFGIDVDLNDGVDSDSDDVE